jgi:hypothetical protein
MDQEVVEIRIEAAVFGLPPSAGRARIRVLPPIERVKNALTKLGICWGIGLFCVFFPIVHFVLVPLFFCLGIYFTAKTAMVRGSVVSGSVPCPGCQEPFVLKPRLAQWPFRDVCSGCRRDLTLSPAADNSGLSRSA